MPPPVGRVRDAVAHGDRVGRRRQRELDVLPGGELDRRAAGRLRRQRVRGPVRADDRAVGGGVLRLLLDEVDGGAAPGDQRRVERGAGHRGAGPAAGPLPPGPTPAPPPGTRLTPAATTATEAAAITPRWRGRWTTVATAV